MSPDNLPVSQATATSWGRLSQGGSPFQQKGETEKAKASYGQAIKLYETLVADFPRVTAYRQRLTDLLTKSGRPQDVENVEALHRERLAEQREAIERLRKRAESGDVQALNEVAWLLATCDFAELRDGPGAVSFAEKAAAATNRKDPMILDTFAAAYAEAGQFAKAVNVQNEGIALLRDEKMKTDYATRLKLYESNSPYRTRN